MQTNQRKAKRKLSNISFEKEGAHIALVSKTNGGPANGHDYALVMKATNFSEEFLEKAAKIRITMDIEDFLVKFYGMYYEDAEVLARALGFDTPEEDMQEEDVPQSYEEYIQAKVEAIEVLKSLHDSDNIAEVLSKLSEEEYLAMLKSQQMLEKTFKKIEKATKESATAVSVTDGEDTSIVGEVNNQEVSPSVEKEELEKSNMTKEVKTEKQEVTIEMVEKSALESIQKAFEEQKQALEKAMQTIAQFEADKKAAIEKARLAEMVSAVKDQAKADTLFKAVKDASDEDFQAVIKALSEMVATIEKSELFEEKGATVEETPQVQESAVAKLLKAKQSIK